MKTVSEKPKEGRRLLRKRPVCPTHEYQLYVGCTRGNIRYLYCPVDGCTHSETQTRENFFDNRSTDIERSD